MRVRHIDNLKFLAIFTVVAWHVMALSTGFINDILSALCSSASSYVFLFLAGYLAYRSDTYSIGSFLGYGHKAAQRLIIPFIVVGGLFGYLHSGSPILVYNGTIQHFWFLPVLFFLMIVGYLILWWCAAVNKITLMWVLLVFGSVWCAFLLAYALGLGGIVPFYRSACVSYPFFVLGIIVARYSVLSAVFEDDRVFALSLPLYFVALYYQQSVPISPFFGLIIWWNVSRKLEGKIPVAIGNLGAYTMPIYIFHFFLMPDLSGFGKWISSENAGALKTNVLYNGNAVLNLLVVGSITVVLIYICVGLAQILKCNYWLRMLLMGDLSGRGK